jgi:hypothetical protein
MLPYNDLDMGGIITNDETLLKKAYEDSVLSANSVGEPEWRDVHRRLCEARNEFGSAVPNNISTALGLDPSFIDTDLTTVLNGLTDNESFTGPDARENYAKLHQILADWQVLPVVQQIQAFGKAHLRAEDFKNLIDSGAYTTIGRAIRKLFAEAEKRRGQGIAACLVCREYTSAIFVRLRAAGEKSRAAGKMVKQEDGIWDIEYIDSHMNDPNTGLRYHGRDPSWTKVNYAKNPNKGVWVRCSSEQDLVNYILECNPPVSSPAGLKLSNSEHPNGTFTLTGFVNRTDVRWDVNDIWRYVNKSAYQKWCSQYREEEEQHQFQRLRPHGATRTETRWLSAQEAEQEALVVSQNGGRQLSDEEIARQLQEEEHEHYLRRMCSTARPARESSPAPQKPPPIPASEGGWIVTTTEPLLPSDDAPTNNAPLIKLTAKEQAIYDRQQEQQKKKSRVILDDDDLLPEDMSDIGAPPEPEEEVPDEEEQMRRAMIESTRSTEIGSSHA